MKKFKNWIKFLGVYQIAGGLVGIMLLAYQFIVVDNIPAYQYYLSILPLSLFLFSIYAGNLLIGKKYLKGLVVSTINQLLQILGFSIGGVMFIYGSGVFLSVGLDLTDDVIFRSLFWTSYADIGIISDKSQFMLTFNIVAIFLLYQLVKLRKQYLVLAPRMK